jgi:methionine synthase II (cobalamin-independent)
LLTVLALWNEHYPDNRAMVLDLCDIMNAELRELAAAGCPVIQVEEPRHHGLTTRPDCTDAELNSRPRHSTASSQA